MVWNLSCTGCRIYGDLPIATRGHPFGDHHAAPKKRIEIPEAIVRWSRGEEFAGENVLVEPDINTITHLHHHVTGLHRNPRNLPTE